MALPDGAAFCPRCGAPVRATAPGGAPAPEFVARAVVIPLAAPYAGFWRRFVALVVDSLILTFVTFPMNLILHVPIFGLLNQDEPTFDELMAILSASVVAILIYSAIAWLYSAFMESSKLQGTLGKLALNIKVTSLEGQRISFARATGRFFGKLLSKFLLIGYLIQPFTQRRQALHDLLAGTLVVRRGAPE